jgi:hypothetical protein
MIVPTAQKYIRGIAVFSLKLLQTQLISLSLRRDSEIIQKQEMVW